MRYCNYLLVMCALMLGVFFAPAVSAQELTLTYYYSIGCPHCANVEPFLDDIARQYPNLNIIKKEVYQNPDNAQEMLEQFNRHHVPQNRRGIPFVVLEDVALTGDSTIIRDLEQVINDYAAAPPSADQENQLTTPSRPLSFIAITGAALVDAINPCAITVLIILLGALLLTKNKKRALWGGLAFSLSIYIAYFLFGLGITYTLHISGLSFLIYKIIGVLAILIGLANIKDFFWYGKGGFVMEIPRSWRPRLQTLLQKVASPVGAFLAGFVVTLFELPCTGGPYFFVLGLLSQNATLSHTIPLLLYYNLVFVLPLLVITGLIYFGFSTIEKATSWKNTNVKVLHLIAGLIMLGLGVWVLLL